MADKTIPRYGTVEAYARILRPLKREHLEGSALAVAQMLLDHPDDSAERKVELVRNLLAAVEQVRNDPAPEPVSEAR